MLFMGWGNVKIVVTLLNVVEFVVVYSRITFMCVNVEAVLLLASVNNILGIVTDNFYSTSVYGPWLFMSEIFLVGVFCVVNHPMQGIIEFKYGYLFRNFSLTKNDFKKDAEKQIIILLLECFRNIYSFDDPTKIKIKENSINQWSANFISRLKYTY